jgi:hypothetical protein
MTWSMIYGLLFDTIEGLSLPTLIIAAIYVLFFLSLS